MTATRDFQRDPDPRTQLAEFLGSGGGNGKAKRRPANESPIGQRITLTFSLPARHAHQNSRAHWKSLQRAVRAMRVEACQRGLQARLDGGVWLPWKAATADVRFFVPNRIRRDPTNLLAACKAFWDGLVDAGLLRDDDQLLVRQPALPQVDAARPRTEVIIIHAEARKENP